MKLVVTASPGIEEECALELEELAGIKSKKNAQHVLDIECDLPALARIMCGSFLASRVLYPMAEFHAWEKEVLYTECLKIDWENIILEGQTFLLDVHGKSDDCDYSSAQGLLKIKDAMVDRIRSKRGSRPDVDKENPTHLIEIYFWRGRVQLSIDLCGEPLHRRGYRKALRGAAPLRESRAAALLRLSSLHLSPNFENIYDPFCGSATIPIEAALMMRKIPPAHKRPIPKKDFLKGFSKLYLDTLQELRAQALPKAPVQIWASDLDERIISQAQAIARKAGVFEDIQFSVGDFKEQKMSSGLLVSNPPYGERLEDLPTVKILLEDLGKKIKFDSLIDKMTLLLPRGLDTAVGLRPAKKLAWKAGPLDLVAAHYEIWRK
jgi:23S rRNA G2445 N2-methylase RlmL